jgi:hypothetical protein
MWYCVAAANLGRRQLFGRLFCTNCESFLSAIAGLETAAASLHFEDSPVQPRLIQLHYVKDELIPVEAA